MDTLICWRPWTSEAAQGDGWTPSVGRLHIDQNPVTRPRERCVQGMIPLYPVTKEVGGLQVVPRSHTDAVQKELAEQYHDNTSGWLQLDVDDKRLSTGKLLLAEPGSLILWDSRAVHGGYIGRGPLPATDRLMRLSMTVAMVPLSTWDDQNPEHADLL